MRVTDLIFRDWEEEAQGRKGFGHAAEDRGRYHYLRRSTPGYGEWGLHNVHQLARETHSHKNPSEAQNYNRNIPTQDIKVVEQKLQAAVSRLSLGKAQ